MTHRYQAFGLILSSDLECPELLPAPPGASADVQVRLAPITPCLDQTGSGKDQVVVAPGVYQFPVDGVARYRVEGGRRILIDPLPGAEPGDVRLWLLGTALGALLHQRGRLPLHVCALAVDGAAVAFCGDSGAGKSTLAAALHRHGLALLTDDVGVAVPAGETVTFHPGFPRIKLWRQTLDHFGLDHRPLIRDLARTDKYHLRLDAQDGFLATPLPLSRLYVLERAEDEGVCIEPVRGHAAIALVQTHTYRPGLVQRLGWAGEHLRQCARVAQRVRVFRYRRPWRLDRLEDALLPLLDHLHGRAL